ncbi:MAG: PD-(D/E)XK nuclease family protein [Armatimonadota bacterium]
MQDWRPSQLSWSFSQKTHFTDCRRYYFYWRFWGQDPKLRWKLYEMRNITTLSMLRGKVTHQVIAESLAALREGRRVDLDAARERITSLMREKMRESYYRVWHIDNRPPGRRASEFTNLLEHYYGFPDTERRARENRDVAAASIENLFRSKLWVEIAETDPATWMAMDEDGFPSFELEGIKVYARPDFAWFQDRPAIIDWKTGAADDDDRRQLVLYSLYARHNWGWEPCEARLAAVYLQPVLKVETFTPTPQDIMDVTELVKSSFEEMLELEPVAFEDADISRFPLTDNPDHCRWCRFQGVCEGAKRLGDVE